LTREFGLIIVDKPIGPTSHRVVSQVRNGTQIRKVGHAGTLDPRASGVLVLCLGQATRLSEFLSTSAKRYEAHIHFGSSTKTYDAEGEVTESTGDAPTEDVLEAALAKFRGAIEQVPPPFSAIKVKGRKAYEIAREGGSVELKPRNVQIHELEIISYEPPSLSLVVECSAGTYIRSLAHELGEAVETGAHLSGLRRVKAGPFSIEDAITLQDLEQSLDDHTWHSHVIPAAEALPDLPAVRVDADLLGLIRNGHQFPASQPAEGLAKAIGPDGELIAILEGVEDGSRWHPRKVFAL
jgi:tRNA pseudouridine55 synthase